MLNEDLHVYSVRRVEAGWQIDAPSSDPDVPAVRAVTVLAAPDHECGSLRSDVLIRLCKIAQAAAAAVRARRRAK
jgi:hypothetical protein